MMSGTQDEREAPEARDDQADGQVSERVSYIRLDGLGDYREPEVRARQAAADRFVRDIGGRSRSRRSR